MCNAAAPWIDSGKLQSSPSTASTESWDNKGPERPRIEMQERWYNYICEEFVPVCWRSTASRARTTQAAS